MMKKLSILILTLFAITLFECRNTKDAAENKVDFQTIASEKLGPNANCASNENNSMTLCSLIKESPDLGAPGVSFLVFDNSTKSIIHKGSIDKGTVGWYYNTKLSLFYTPGVMMEGQTRDDFTKIYDLIKKTTTPKKELPPLVDN